MKKINTDIKHPDVGVWFERALDDPFVLGERDCPCGEFTPEQWKELLLNDTRVFQFDFPEAAVRRILTAADFADWESSRVCDALFFGGGLLDDLLPTGNISQEDFDFYFGAEIFTDAEEFWNVAPGFFPHGFPPHLELPYPRKKADRKEDPGHRS